MNLMSTVWKNFANFEVEYYFFVRLSEFENFLLWTDFDKFDNLSKQNVKLI
jgi:hypothetical protein